MIASFGIIAALFVVLGIIIILGKGDMLISGYNTASEEEHAKVNKKRMRQVIACLLWSVAILLTLGAIYNNPVFFGAITVLALIAIVLLNTWCKNK